MDIRDYYWGLYRGYYRDPFPHSLLRDRHSQRSLKRDLLPKNISAGYGGSGRRSMLTASMLTAWWLRVIDGRHHYYNMI